MSNARIVFIVIFVILFIYFSLIVFVAFINAIFVPGLMKELIINELTIT